MSSTRKLDLRTIALLQEAAYLLSEGRDVPVIVALHVPGRDPLIVISGPPKATMRLSARIEARMDELLGKVTLVEIVSEADES